MDNPAKLAICQGMTSETDILIVGGGLNGPVLALALAQAGFGVILVDAQPVETRAAPAFDGRAYALALTSVRLLKRIGLWDQVSEHAQAMLDVKVTDGDAGRGPSPFFLHFDHDEVGEEPLGHMLEDRFLRQALLAAMAAAPAITHIAPARVTGQTVTETGAELHLDDGTSLLGQMLIAADGRNSDTAQRAGIKRTGWGYGQTALVCAIAHDLPHNGVAHQFFMPSGPLAILPLPGNVSAIVWTESDETAARINALPDADYLSVLAPRFGDFLGDIHLKGARYTYPLSLSLADRLVDTRLALIGDAAHGVHPLAGQGLNAGLRDIAALVQVLEDARLRGEDIASEQVLMRYQEWRRFDTMSLAVTTDTINRVFSNANPLLRAARDLGMGVVNALPGVRRSLMREAAGLNGDLPRLMQP